MSKSKCTNHLSFGALLKVEMSKKCTPLWREEHFQVKMFKTHQRRTSLGSCDFEKGHAIVARSTFPSQKCKKLTVPDHFLTFRCRKSVRRCGVKHIWKSKVSRTEGSEPFLMFRCRKKLTLTNSTNLAYLTCFTCLPTLTNLTILTNLTD